MVQCLVWHKSPPSVRGTSVRHWNCLHCSFMLFPCWELSKHWLKIPVSYDFFFVHYTFTSLLLHGFWTPWRRCNRKQSKWFGAVVAVVMQFPFMEMKPNTRWKEKILKHRKVLAASAGELGSLISSTSVGEPWPQCEADWGCSQHLSRAAWSELFPFLEVFHTLTQRKEDEL